MRSRSVKPASPPERILAAAKEEFARKGLSGARIGSIAARARVNPALIHYYFKTKEDLYARIVGDIFGTLNREDFLNKLKAFNLRPPQKLYIALYLIVHLFLKPRDPNNYMIIFRELADGSPYLKKVAQGYIIPGRREIVLNIICEGIETGDFSTRFPAFLVHGIFAFVTDLVLFRDIYSDTVWNEILKGEHSTERVLEYLLEKVFRELSAGREEPSLPEIPGELPALLDEIIRNF